MLSQDYPDFEVVVVNDHSTDNSGVILKDMISKSQRLRVIDAEWNRFGKRAALAQGSMAAYGDWFLFTDADVTYSPEALSRGMAFAEREHVDGLSLFPQTLAVSLWEQVGLAAIAWLACSGASIEKCNNDNAPVGLAAAGPYMLVHRTCYEAIGGYDAVLQNVLLDCALAIRIRQAGFRYRYADSGGLVKARMYRSLWEMIEGFSKNAYVALGSRLTVALVAMVGFLGITILPLLLVIILFWSVWEVGFQAIPGAAVSIAGVAAMFFGQFKAAQFMGTVPRFPCLLLSPVGAFLWSSIMVHSILQYYFKNGVLWKGRRIPISPEVVLEKMGKSHSDGKEDDD
jgi:chlorobactene glucosyltransferase